MRGDATSMFVIQPRTVQEAVEACARAPDALPMAGGTDLMVAWNLAELNGRTVVDLSMLSEWARIEARRSSLRIGACVTHAALQRDRLARRHFPLLLDGCSTVGGVQIQNRGTLGGNIANASPAGDTFPPLAVYEAIIHVTSTRGRRRIPFLDVFAGPKETTLAPGELIDAVELPFPRRRPDRQMFRKVGTRAAQAISKAVAAGLLWLAPDGTVEELRFALGSVAPTVRRMRQAEASVRGKYLTHGVVSAASELVGREIAPIDDVRSTSDYRLTISKRLLVDFLEAGYEQA